MRRLNLLGLWAIRLWNDRSGQDMIEYALLAAALVVIVAGFLPPQLIPSVSTIFSKISQTLNSI
jgi:Flp pilus assembly pilin Flp